MRYYRQGYEIPVEIDPTLLAGNGTAMLAERFNQLHEQFYGFRMEGSACEIVNLRAIGYGKVPEPQLPEDEPGAADASDAVIDEHEVYFQGGWLPTRIYDRAKLRPGHRIEGPGDRDRVRLDDGRPLRLRRRGRPLPEPDHQPDGGVTMDGVKVADIPQIEVDPVTLDIIEGALKNARFEMDEVALPHGHEPGDPRAARRVPDDHRPERAAWSSASSAPTSRRCSTPSTEPVRPGDVILTNDPYICKGSISHINDWLVCLPIFRGDELVGFASIFGHMMDVGGPLPGAQPTGAKTIFGRGSASRRSRSSARACSTRTASTSSSTTPARRT